MIPPAVAVLCAVVGVAVWWAGRGLDAAGAAAWLSGWTTRGNAPLVALAAPTAIAIVAAVVGVAAWMHGGTRNALGVASRGAIWLAAMPTLLLIDDPMARGVFASTALVAFAWLQGRAVWPHGRAAQPNATPEPAQTHAPWSRSWRAYGHWVLAGICLLTLGGFAQARHDAHWTSLIDLGLFFEQYHNAEGRLLYAPTLGMSFLGEHFSPILVLLWPILKLWPDPSALLWIQALAITGAGLVLHRLAVERTGNLIFAQVLLVAWCLNPWVQQAAFYDFHMDLLESPLLFGACLAAMTRKNALMWVCAIGLWLTKEDTFIYTSAIAAWLLLQPGRRRLGAALFAVGLLQAGVLLSTVLPALRPPHDPSFFSTTGATESYAFLGRYSHLGSTPGEIVGKLVTNPFYVVSHVLSGQRLARVVSLLVGFGGLALAGRWRWLWLLPAGEMLVANAGPMSHFHFYYGAVIVPFAAIAAVEGFRALGGESTAARQLRMRQRRAIVAVALGAGLALFVHPSSGFAPETAFQDYARSDRQERIDEALRQIPSGESVAATGYLSVRLQRDHHTTMLPFGVDDADWIVVDLQRPAWPSNIAAVQGLVRRMLGSGDWVLHPNDIPLFFVAQRTPPATELPRDGTEGRTALNAWDQGFSDFTLEAELSESTHYRGRFAGDETASNGRHLAVAAADSRGPGHALWGPYVNLRPTRYAVTFSLRWAPGGRVASADTVVATIDVHCASGVAAHRDLTAGMLDADSSDAPRSESTTGDWSHWTLDVDLQRNARGCESRVYYHDYGTLDVDAVHWVLAADAGR